MRMRRLVIAAVLAAGLGCSSTPDWSDYLRDHLPRESPRMAAARLQFALAYGPAGDSYESLTKITQWTIPYWKWKILFPHLKDPETGVKIVDIMMHSKVDAWYETGKDKRGRTTAEVLTYYDEAKQAYSIKLSREGEEWKLGLVESFFPDKEEEYWEEQRKEREKAEKPPEP